MSFFRWRFSWSWIGFVLAIGFCASAWSADNVPRIPAGYDPGLGREEIFNQANNYYRDSKLEEALAGYTYLADLGVSNGYLFYNLGNTHFRLGHTGVAILWYERAKRYLPRFSDLLFNLNYARSTLVDEEFKPPVYGGTVGFLIQLHHALNLRDSLGLLRIIIWLFLGSLSAFLLVALPPLRAGCKMLAWSAGILLALGILSTGYKIHQQEYVMEAVITAPAIDVTTGPGPDFSTAFSLHEGTKVQVMQRQETWMRIVLPGNVGFTGWIPSESVEIM